MKRETAVQLNRRILREHPGDVGHRIMARMTNGACEDDAIYAEKKLRAQKAALRAKNSKDCD